MKPLPALLALALLSGCAGMASGYYTQGRGAIPTPGKHDVLCRLPKTAMWDRSYAIANNAATCREFGGQVVKVD